MGLGWRSGRSGGHEFEGNQGWIFGGLLFFNQPGVILKFLRNSNVHFAEVRVKWVEQVVFF